MISPFTPQIRYSLTQLRQYILDWNDPELFLLIKHAHQQNAWFTPEEIQRALMNIAVMLEEKVLEKWMEIELKNNPSLPSTSKVIGLILAGNLPLVGFHDILSVLLTGHKALIKLSSQDKSLIPFIVKKLFSFYPELEQQIIFTERLEGYDAVIATGSNNSSRYFESYFGKVPHIIRKNRNSIAILDGTETKDDLTSLGHDIFDFFGLGCRNISKIYVPQGYDFTHFFESIESFHPIINHHKYANNYEYNKAIYLVNKDKHFDNGFLLVKQDDKNMLSSPLGSIFYEEYEHPDKLTQKLMDSSDQIQIIMGNTHLALPNEHIAFGNAQQPFGWNYADGVNTITFLLGL